MEKYKIQNWEKDNINIRFKSLNEKIYKIIFQDIIINYQLDRDYFKNNSFFTKLSNILHKKEVLLSINDEYGFSDLIKQMKIEVATEEIITIIWNYDEVDQIECNYLQNYWDYIWYGPSDEVCLLYFTNLKKLLLITDYGTIQY